MFCSCLTGSASCFTVDKNTFRVSHSTPHTALCSVPVSESTTSSTTAWMTLPKVGLSPDLIWRDSPPVHTAPVVVFVGTARRCRCSAGWFREFKKYSLAMLPLKGVGRLAYAIWTGRLISVTFSCKKVRVPFFKLLSSLRLVGEIVQIGLE